MRFLPGLVITLGVSLLAAPVGAITFAESTEISEDSDSSADLREFLIRSTPEAAAKAGFDGATIAGSGWSKITIASLGDASTQARQLADRTGLVVEPNYLYQLTEEPIFSDQWALVNIGQTGGTPDADIDILEAWNVTTGDPSLIIGVLDSGASLFHVDLAPVAWRNPGEIEGNGKDDDGNGFVDDIHGWNIIDRNFDVSDDIGHGTFVASVAVAAINDVGIAGVSPGSKFMPVRVCDNACPMDAIIEGIWYAVANGADILNLSFGGPEDSLALRDAVTYAINSGVPVIAAAGNESKNNDSVPTYPANYAIGGVISVASTDHNDQLANFSNYGATTVDVAAPGEAIRGADRSGDWTHRDGTSFSAPIVTGVAALFLSLVPDASPAAVERALIASSDPVLGLLGTSVSGGRVNAATMVSSLQFIDIYDSAFFDSILWMRETGITSGCNPPDNDLFCPDSLVTRGQMAAFLVRALGYTDDGGGNLFIDDDVSIFEPDIDRLGTAGVTLGCNPPTNNQFCPDSLVTRGQMAAFLQRALG